MHPAPSLVSVNENILYNEMEILPTANGLRVVSEKNIDEITVTDLQGRNLVNLKNNLGSDYELNLNAYGNQTLIVNVRSGEHWFNKKFVWMR